MKYIRVPLVPGADFDKASVEIIDQKKGVVLFRVDGVEIGLGFPAEGEHAFSQDTIKSYIDKRLEPVRNFHAEIESGVDSGSEQLLEESRELAERLKAQGETLNVYRGWAKYGDSRVDGFYYGQEFFDTTDFTGTELLAGHKRDGTKVSSGLTLGQRNDPANKIVWWDFHVADPSADRTLKLQRLAGDKAKGTLCKGLSPEGKELLTRGNIAVGCRAPRGLALVDKDDTGLRAMVSHPVFANSFSKGNAPEGSQMEFLMAKAPDLIEHPEFASAVKLAIEQGKIQPVEKEVTKEVKVELTDDEIKVHPVFVQSVESAVAAAVSAAVAGATTEAKVAAVAELKPEALVVHPEFANAVASFSLDELKAKVPQLKDAIDQAIDVRLGSQVKEFLAQSMPKGRPVITPPESGDAAPEGETEEQKQRKYARQLDEEVKARRGGLKK